MLAYDCRDYAAARPLLEETLKLKRAQGEPWDWR